MSIRFDDPAEAFAAVATMVIASDNVGTMKERDFLFERVKNLEVFETHDQAAFAKLIARTVERICQMIPEGEVSLDKERAERLTQAVKAALTPQLRRDAFRMAVDLAAADTSSETEKTSLEILRHGLEIGE